MIFLLWIYNNVQHVVWTLFLVRMFLSKKISIFFFWLELFLETENSWNSRITENKSSFFLNWNNIVKKLS